MILPNHSKTPKTCPHSGSEDLLLRRLTEDPRPFQQIFDRFVREVCVPRIAEVYQSAVGTGAYGDDTD